MGANPSGWSETAGILICLGAASSWAVAVTIFRRPIEAHGARTVNLVKCSLATVLQGVTVWLFAMHGALAAASLESIAFVVASGIVGLALGDTALFGAVARLGAHRTLLLQTLTPVFTAAMAAAWQADTPSPRQAVGILLVLAGVATVIDPRSALRAKVTGWSGAGVALGTLAAAGQAGGIVLAKHGMHEIPPMPASFLRLAAATVGLLLVAAVGGRLHRVGGLLADRARMGRVVPATLLGTYLALFAMMAGVALAPAAVAAVLLSTSPVFSLFIDRWIYKTSLRPAAVIGTLTAVAGVAVLTSG
jgi:drug/metabolite transporter (DMT)-like permease